MQRQRVRRRCRQLRALRPQVCCAETACSAGSTRRRAVGIVWICAPAGAGKTALVSTWIETRGIASLWYRIDARDGDLGGLFQCLRLAVCARPNAQPLPAFVPAHASALDVFGRRFFEAWFACFDEAVTLVFDNYEQAPADAHVGETLAALLAAMPEHVRAVVIVAARRRRRLRVGRPARTSRRCLGTNCVSRLPRPPRWPPVGMCTTPR